MRLQRVDSTTLVFIEEVVISNDMYWEDEFSWSPVVRRSDYSLTGAMIVEIAKKQTGRPITLRPPDQEMAWVDRSVALKLAAWMDILDLKMKLVLEYPNDTRQFLVAFADGDNPVTANPVRGFPGHETSDEFQVSIKLKVIA